MYDQIASNARKSYLLVSIFIAFIVFLGYVIGAIYGNVIFFVPIAVIIAMVYVMISYYAGDKIVIATSGAKEVSKKEQPFFHNTVEGLAIAAGIPKPKIYIIPSMAINAFATGRNPEKSHVAVTKGALEKLNRAELEGVLAHEISHIKNQDIRFMMLVAVLIGIVTIISHFLLRSTFYSRDQRNNNAIFLIIGLILAILSPLIAQIIQFAISRRREFLADASGAMLTRYPKGLADALRKIKNDNQPLQASNATAHMYISNPFKKKQFFSNLFSTHPPLDERIRSLEKM